MTQVRCADRKGSESTPATLSRRGDLSVQLLIANMQPLISSNLEVDLTD